MSYAKIPKRNRKADLPSLSEQYYKSRKQLTLYSALLFAWEFIGVGLPEANQSIFKDINITLKSPQAVPWVLVALILYFGFRTIIEWYQSDSYRRGLRASKFDLLTTFAIASMAVALFGVQQWWHVQVFDGLDDVSKLIGHLFMGTLTGVFSGFVLSVWLMTLKKFKKRKDRFILSIFFPIILALVLLLVYYIEFKVIKKTYSGLLNSSLSFVIALFFTAFIVRRKLLES